MAHPASEARIARIVVACPSDAQDEADRIPAILAELNRSVAADRGLRLDLVRWKSHTYPGLHAAGPQGLIDPILQIPKCEVLIAVFWSRFGTPTGDSLSGTEHEIRLAIEAWKSKASPQVMVYFNMTGVAPQTLEDYEQYGRVLKFRTEFPKEGLWWPYQTPDEFEDLVRNHLANYIRTQFPISGGAAQPGRRAESLERGTDYFAVQRTIIAEQNRRFVGRIYALEAFETFCRTHDRGYFLIRGGPGQGKTALACALIARWSAVHHLVSKRGGRADDRLTLLSLMAQIPDARRPQSDSLANLTKAYEEALAAASSGRPAVVVIDAIDELPEGAPDPAWLPAETIPPNLYFVVTSRPGLRLDSLRERLYATPHATYDLDPLTLAEMHGILGSLKISISDSEVERIGEASQGNPLYLRALVDELRRDPNFPLDRLPASVEGFFRRATSELSAGNRVLADVLAVMSVARTALSVRDLAAITGASQRDIDERAIRLVLSFLLEVGEGYTFYHARFHEFVNKEVVYEDERRAAHAKVVEWLQRRENANYPYRYESLAFHLFESGDAGRLERIVDEPFLGEKVRRLGYGVLEDLELLTRSLLARNEPGAVDRCMALVEAVRSSAGENFSDEVARAVQSYRAGPAAFRTRLIELRPAPCPGVDAFAALLPKGKVAADFVEFAAAGGSLFIAIGDAPAIGLKSAFVARFLGNSFRHFVGSLERPAPAAILEQVARTAGAHPAFHRVSMQCVQVDRAAGLVRIASAGHPDPVHYVARRRKCDVLRLRSHALLGDLEPGLEEFGLEFEPGDILVLVSDGLTDDHILQGDAYGYRFTHILESRSDAGAEALAEAILDAWRAHPRDEDIGDDASVIVVKTVHRA